MDREEWFKLPLEVRKIWWSDTDYGRHEPSPEMLAVLEKVHRGEYRGDEWKEYLLLRLLELVSLSEASRGEGK